MNEPSLSPIAEQRAYPRFEVVVPAELAVEGGDVIAGSARNLSRGGLLVSVPQPLEVGEHCAVDLDALFLRGRLPLDWSGDSGARSATVVRSQVDQSRYLVALQFDSPVPAPRNKGRFLAT
ncbi:MAG: PilZ domain-containing protein [Deltaproteobacteria bacterium]|nr:PilZ domain-containing protein [Deltaproteobacteria bacterium]